MVMRREYFRAASLNGQRKHKALSWAYACKLEKQFESEVKELIRLADEANVSDLPDGFSIPEEFEARGKRLTAIRDAKDYRFYLIKLFRKFSQHFNYRFHFPLGYFLFIFGHPVQRMKNELRNEASRAIYAKCKSTVEPDRLLEQ